MIIVKKLYKYYKTKEIFNDVNLTISKNKISFLIGDNGYGKTTFIKCLVGLENKTGEIIFDGKTLDESRSEISVVYDDSPLYLNLTGLQNIQLLARNCSLDDIKRVSNNFIEYKDLNQKSYKYSYGQKKKVSIIIALLKKPKYLFMDEVSNGLDYETSIFLKNKLKEISENTTIFLTGHQFEFYNEIIDDIFVLKDKNISRYVRKDKTLENGGYNLEDVYKENFKFNCN